MAAPARPTLTFSVEGPITRADLPGLCDRICRLLTAHHPTLALCDVRTVAPDAVTIDALSRLQLAAQRFGCRVELQHASPELVGLVTFLGLSEIFATSA